MLLLLLLQTGADWSERVTRERAETPEAAFQLGGTAGLWLSASDNIFLNARGEQRGREADLQLQAFLDGRIRRTTDDIDAGAWAIVNGNAHTADADLNDVEARLLGSFEYRGRRTLVEVTELVRRESQPDDVVFSGRESRFQHDFTARGRQELGERLAAHVRLSNQFTDVRHVDTGDNMTWIGGLGVSYEYAEEARAGLELEFTSIDYRRDLQADSQGVTVRAGLSGALLERLRGSAGIGWFAHEAEANAAGHHARASGPALLADLSYDLTERLDAGFGLSRSVTFSPTADFNVTTSARLSARYELGENLSARLAAIFSHIHSVGGPEQEDVALRLSASWQMSERVSAEGAAHHRRVYRDPGFDYVENLVSVGVRVAF
jgi:hypothetical protein